MGIKECPNCERQRISNNFEIAEMRCLLAIFCLSMIADTDILAQSISLKGRAILSNSKHRTGELVYIKDAYFSAGFAIPANSDDSGKFELIFSKIKPGTSVKVQAEKYGYALVNDYDLEQ